MGNPRSIAGGTQKCSTNKCKKQLDRKKNRKKLYKIFEMSICKQGERSIQEKECASRNTQMSSVSGRIYCSGTHLYMLWPWAGIGLLLWGEMSQQFHEAQPHVSQYLHHLMSPHHQSTTRFSTPSSLDGSEGRKLFSSVETWICIESGLYM